jgi:hypothetical protein
MGIAALLAFFLMRHFGLAETMKLDNDMVAQVIVAGTGAMVVIAMVVIRSKLFTIRQPNGTGVAFGPAFAVDTFLAVVNREVDRRLAADRNQPVADWAHRLSNRPFADAVPFLLGALSAFQDMDENAAKKLRGEFRPLIDDAQLRG